MRLLPFKTILHDTIRLDPGAELEPSYSLFQPDSTGVGNDIKSLQESAILEMLFSNWDYRQLVLGELNMSAGSEVLLNVQEPIARRGMLPGDFDVVAGVPSLPHYAVAIEAKRVCVVAERAEVDKRSRHKKRIEELVRQTKGLVKHGFYQSYACLLVTVLSSARSKEKGNVFYSGAGMKTFELLAERLHEVPVDVGVIIIQLNQPSEKAFSSLGSVGVYVARKARPQGQSVEVTNRIKALWSSEELVSRYRCKCN